MIVKVQAAIVPSDALVIVYEKDSSITFLFQLGELPGHVQNALANYPKQFFEVEVRDDKTLNFGNLLGDQGW